MIVDTQTMAKIDKKTIEGFLPGETLMENAGRKTTEEILEHYYENSKIVRIYN